MTDLLKFQYQLIKESRAVVFSYLETEVKQDFLKTLETFNDKNIVYMLVHIANTYIAWAGNFALGMERPFYEEKNMSTPDQLRTIFEEVNLVMEQFISKFTEDPLTPVKGYKWADKYIETDAYGIFTHVLTHEFHHKGQMMTMSRLLGHMPPDTDVMRF
jgi:uncharacterized damage-inducible protein DinB